MTFKEQEQLLNKPYWNKQDIAQFFTIGNNKATEYKKKVFAYMKENNITQIDTRRMPYQAVKEALDIKEFFIRNQARKDRKEE